VSKNPPWARPVWQGRQRVMRDVISIRVTLRAMYICFNGHLDTQSFKRSSVSQNITQVRCLSIDGGGQACVFEEIRKQDMKKVCLSCLCMGLVYRGGKTRQVRLTAAHRYSRIGARARWPQQSQLEDLILTVSIDRSSMRSCVCCTRCTEPLKKREMSAETPHNERVEISSGR